LGCLRRRQHLEALYDHARDELVRYIGASGADAGAIEAFQRLEDKRLFEELGYSATRFATSFENTLRRFVPDASVAQLGCARHFAQSVFERPAEVDPDASEVLSCLRSSHHLALVTAGERWVQERRLAAFRYTDMFDVIRIVEQKTAVLFRKLSADLAIETGRPWVVGDSLRSDIMPALGAGMNAILIANHNWIEVELLENRPDSLNVVTRLGDVLPIIVTAGIETPAPAHP
jgi:putative hydrolase of the HAD superfamily